MKSNIQGHRIMVILKCNRQYNMGIFLKYIGDFLKVSTHIQLRITYFTELLLMRLVNNDTVVVTVGGHKYSYCSHV